MKRTFTSLFVALLAMAGVVSPAQASDAQENISARGSIPEAAVVANASAAYSGAPSRVTLTGVVDLSKLRVRSRDTVRVGYRFILTSTGCSAPSPDRRNLALGASITSRCDGRNTVTEVSLTNTIQSSSAAGSGGVIISTYAIPFTAARGSRFLSLALDVTASGTSRTIRLNATKTLPNH